MIRKTELLINTDAAIFLQLTIINIICCCYFLLFSFLISITFLIINTIIISLLLLAAAKFTFEFLSLPLHLMMYLTLKLVSTIFYFLIFCQMIALEKL